METKEKIDIISKWLKNLFSDLLIDYDEDYKRFIKESWLSETVDHEDEYFYDLVDRYFDKIFQKSKKIKIPIIRWILNSEKWEKNEIILNKWIKITNEKIPLLEEHDYKQNIWYANKFYIKWDKLYFECIMTVNKDLEWYYPTLWIIVRDWEEKDWIKIITKSELVNIWVCRQPSNTEVKFIF